MALSFLLDNFNIVFYNETAMMRTNIANEKG